MMKPTKVDQIETMKHNIIPGKLRDHRSKRNMIFFVCVEESGSRGFW